MAFINDITINISRGTVGLSGRSFDPLVLGTGSVASGVITVSELTDLTDAGYTSSDAEYDMVSAMFSQSPRPSIVKVARKVDGDDYDDALDNIRESDDSWYTVCIDSRTDADLNAVGTWANANSKFFVGCAESVTALGSRNVDREAYIIHDNDADDYPDCAWVGRCIPRVPGSLTWKWKRLSGQNASTFTSSELAAIRAANGQALQEQAGSTFVNEGITTSGEYIDVIMGQDWVDDQLRIELLRLMLVNDRIPYDDTGIAMVEGVVRSVLKRAGDNGIIARAVSEDDLLASDDKVYMYQVTVPKRSETSANERATRTLNDVKFVYTTAGAIHKTTVTGVITV